MEIFDESVKKITFKDYDNNKQFLAEMRERLTTEFLKNKEFQGNFFIENLYKSTVDEDWFLAQCQSACNQITKIVDHESKFHKNYDCILQESDLLLLSQEIIFDLHQLDDLSGKKINCDSTIWHC